MLISESEICRIPQRVFSWLNAFSQYVESGKMADKAVPDLDAVVGYFIERDGKLVWEVYNGEPSTFRLGLIELLKSAPVKSVYLLVSGTIWMRLPI